MMYALGIETSCDETSVSVVKDRRVLSCLVSSSLDLHKKYGGIIPEIASRRHVKVIDGLTLLSLKKAKVSLGSIDLVAVTQGPGLVGSLLIGVSFAKSLAFAQNLPVLGVNHLHAHLFVGLMGLKRIKFPFLGLVVSGGHTQLYLVRDFDRITTIGKSIDDAAGESLDKVGRFYGLGFPAGPEIDSLYDETVVDKNLFKRRYNSSLDFSFSGIKTKAVYLHKELTENKKLSQTDRVRILSSFQYGVVDSVIDNLLRAVNKYRIKRVVAGGGVSANTLLRNRLNVLRNTESLDIVICKKEFCQDNAAGVAGLGEYLYKKGHVSGSEIKPLPRLS